MRKTFCDSCGKDVTTSYFRVYGHISKCSEPLPEQVEERVLLNDKDLCRECLDRVEDSLKWINS